MNSSEFERRFDAGDSVLESLDVASARRPRLQQKRVNVDFPLWMVEQLDLEASRPGRDPAVDHQGLAIRALGPTARQ